jgi:hypothetical protein
LDSKVKGEHLLLKGSPGIVFANAVLLADKLNERKAELMDGKQRINKKVFGIARIINQSDNNLDLFQRFFTTSLGRKFGSVLIESC